MFLKSRKRHTTLAMGLVCLSLCGCQPTEKAAEPTAEKSSEQTGSRGLGEKMERAQANMPQVLLKEVDQTAKRQKDLQEAKKKRIKETGRGCLDDQSDAYLVLPLKVVNPVFRPCAANLSALTQVPLMLPPEVSAVSQTGFHAYFDGPDINADKYLIGLTYDLAYAYELKWGSFSGKTLTADASSLREQFEKEITAFDGLPHYQAQLKEAGAVTLVNGIEGYYYPGVCGANCHGSIGSITWDQDGYRYRISARIGQKKEMLRMVNTAIENQAN
jgi:hypothetical protein